MCTALSTISVIIPAGHSLARVTFFDHADERNRRFALHQGLFGLGGYFSNDFLTMSSSLASIWAALLFSARAIVRQTRERVVGSLRSMTNVPSVYGTLTTRVPHPRHPAG